MGAESKARSAGFRAGKWRYIEVEALGTKTKTISVYENGRYYAVRQRQHVFRVGFDIDLSERLLLVNGTSLRHLEAVLLESE